MVGSALRNNGNNGNNDTPTDGGMIGTGPVFDDELDRRRGERVQVRMRVNTLIRSDSCFISQGPLFFISAQFI